MSVYLGHPRAIGLQARPRLPAPCARAIGINLNVVPVRRRVRQHLTEIFLLPACLTCFPESHLDATRLPVLALHP